MQFLGSLCKYPGDPKMIAEAQRHILEGHAERLTKETGKPATVEDIEEGRAPRPKVLDMFAGGGAIPLEALRLGCEAYALDLNPVAHIIELCTLVYPQKYGKPDHSARGMTGPTNTKNETTWGGLAKEVHHWGEWVLKKVKSQIGDLYPLIPDPAYKKNREPVKDIFGTDEEVPPGYFLPVAYLWTRTVVCKNPTCKATVPLVKQTWLCKKKGRCIALKVVVPTGAKHVSFEVVESTTEKGLGFDPSLGSEGGNAACPFCHNIANADYVQQEGVEKRIGKQLMAVICARPGATGKAYYSGDGILGTACPDDTAIESRITDLASSGVHPPCETINHVRPSPNARGMSAVTRHGISTFRDLFSPRQLLCLLAFAASVRSAADRMKEVGLPPGITTAVLAYLALLQSRLADWNSTIAHWVPIGEKVTDTFARQAIPMCWDFCEIQPLESVSGNSVDALERMREAIEALSESGTPAQVQRGSATRLPWPDLFFDAVITDPPYYDNVPYADISDFFYVWLRRTIGSQFSEHFASDLTPKKSEATALSSRHGGDMSAAEREYESMMAQSFRDAHRVLKHGGQMTVVYAHKTTLGWSTLVDALRKAGFVVTEAWPLDTEKPGRMLAQDTAALASSIFLVGRKRDSNATGSYESDVQPELEAIVRERVETLWDQGISGADLVIACVGAGLRAFTSFARVEYANGDEVPAERFLTEVETVVLDSILSRLSKEVGGKGTSLAGVDPATRFYTLWRYTYRAAELEAGEAIIFANGTHVELDGPSGMSSGADALVEKKKGKYRLRDFGERGDDDGLGQPTDAGQAAPLVDVLHRVLWLMEHRPRELPSFLRDTEPNREQLRLVAQALGGPALKGGELADVSPTGEMAALAKLTSNWRSVIEDNATTVEERADQKHGQKKLFE
jgi:putative DNA methylase